MAFWTPQPKPGEGAVVDVTALWPKLSARVPDDLHQRVRIAAIQRHQTVQALLICALEAWLTAPG